MKAYAVIDCYFNGCDVWENWESFHLNEDSAKLREIEIGCRYLEEGISLDPQWVEVREIEIQ